MTSMIGRPEPNEAASYYFGYINRVSGDDILREMQRQVNETPPFLRRITEEKSLWLHAGEMEYCANLLFFTKVHTHLWCKPFARLQFNLTA